MSKNKKKLSYRIDILALAAIFIFLVTFLAYMMNTSVVDVLKDERKAEIITHDYTYNNSQNS